MHIPSSRHLNSPSTSGLQTEGKILHKIEQLNQSNLPGAGIRACSPLVAPVPAVIIVVGNKNLGDALAILTFKPGWRTTHYVIRIKSKAAIN